MTKRDYKAATAYENKPEQVKKRVMRNQARAAMEKKLGRKLKPTEEVDHKKMLKDGGSNKPGNTRVVSEKKNTAWRKGVKAYG